MQKKLSVSSGTSNAKAYHRSFGFTFVINAFMCAALVILISFYIVRSNGVAAHTYQIKLLSEQLAAAQSATTELMAKRTYSEDPDVLAQFAMAHNMVPAQDVLYLSERGNVALK